MPIFSIINQIPVLCFLSPCAESAQMFSYFVPLIINRARHVKGAAGLLIIPISGKTAVAYYGPIGWLADCLELTVFGQ